jgi:hypothetical protein
MSCSDYLRTKLINSPKIIDVSQKFGDTSNYIWNRKLATSYVSRPSDHVINNQSDPFLTSPSSAKQPISYSGTQGGKVRDTSLYTLSLAAASIAQNTFSPTKLVVGGGAGNKCLASPAPSLIINESGNTDQKRTGLNMGHVINTCPNIYNPLTKSYFVDTIPDLKTQKINSLVGCSSTTTRGNWNDKEEKTLNLYSLRPPVNDFLTAPLGPQVSQNGSSAGRAGKVGSALKKNKYVEKHHGNVQVNLPVYKGFIPTSGAPAQLKINSPQHYPVA